MTLFGRSLPEFTPGLAEVSVDDKEKQSTHKDALFFDPPIHTDQAVAYSLIKDAGQNKDISRGIMSVASFLKSDHTSTSQEDMPRAEKRHFETAVVPMDAHLEAIRDQYTVDGHFDPELFDQAVDRIIDQQIEKHGDPKVIPIALMYTFIEPNVIHMARHIKEKYPDKIVVVGSNHASFASAELLAPPDENHPSTGIDIVIRGEGEWTMQKLMEELEKPDPDLSKIKGISWRDKEGSYHANNARNRGDLYQLPPLDYSLLDSPEGAEKFNNTAMLVRGCKGNCAFCTSPAYWDMQITEGTLNNFRTELEYLASNGAETISVLDDDIMVTDETFNKTVGILAEIKAKYPNVKFIAQTRVVHLRDGAAPEERLARMKEAGVSRLYIGIESGSQAILREMRKGYKVDWAEEACHNVKNAGIETGGFWLFGHPGANAEEEEKSLAFMEKLLQQGLLDDVEAHAVVPFPGTAVADEIIKIDGRIEITDENKKHYGFLNNYPVYNLVERDRETGDIIKTVLTAEQINGYLNQALELREQYLGVPVEEANRSLNNSEH